VALIVRWGATALAVLWLAVGCYWVPQSVLSLAPGYRLGEALAGLVIFGGGAAACWGAGQAVAWVLLGFASDRESPGGRPD
jgi:hypothetical protein